MQYRNPSRHSGVTSQSVIEPLIVPRNNAEHTPNNSPRSDGGGRQIGGVLGRMPDDDHGNEIGRFRWTDGLRDDLLDAYQLSEPARRGYMARMHALWCDKHPELNNFSKQHLRDYVAYLRRSGYVRTPQQHEVPQQNEPMEALQGQGLQEPEHIAADEASTINTEEKLSDRKARINIKHHIKQQDLARINAELQEKLREDVNILGLNNAVYCAARRLVPRRRPAEYFRSLQKIERRIQKIANKINLARQHASRIQCVLNYISTNRPFTAKIRKTATKLRRQHHTLNKTILVTIKQRCLDQIRSLNVTKNSLKKKAKGIRDNNAFLTRPSSILQERAAGVNNLPPATEVEDFWKGVYGSKKPLRADTPSLTDFVGYCQRVQTDHQECPPITTEEVKKALDGVRNYSAPGPDGINNFWWKKLHSTHPHLARIYNSWLSEGTSIPEWFVEGRTTLIPKKGDSRDPRNYRPITCLNTSYKIFTRILYCRVLSAIEPVLSDITEQRGGRRRLEGCKENLLIDRCVTQDSIQYKRNLSMAWIDYKKAFDTTSHQLLITLLRTLKVPNSLVDCIEHLMPLWKTRFSITSGTNKITTQPITFQRGVFQGDSLSPLLFCISLLPISVSLRKTRGYCCGPPGNRARKVTHLFYVDDLKLYATSQRDLQQSLKVVQEYSRDIGMEFGLDKCAVLRLDKGRYGNNQHNEQLADGSVLRHLDEHETYSYLGVDQNRTQDADNVKTALRSRYRQRLRKIWCSELSGKNKVIATNVLAVPILLYSFGVVKWTREQLRELDVSTRKMMHIHHSIHPRSSVPRIYLPRHQGGRGLLSLESMHDRLVLAMACKIIKSPDALLRLVRDHETANVGAFLFRAAEKAAEKLGLRFNLGTEDEQSLVRLEPQIMKNQIRKSEQQRFLQDHTNKPQHGVFFRNIEQMGLSRRLTFAFLDSADLKSETEGFLLACQDGVINTLVYRSQFSNVDDTRCRACRQQPETLMHILSACPVHAIAGYIHRHNAALKVLYYHLRHAYGIDEAKIEPHASDDVEVVVENDRCRIYWNYAFPTPTRVQANKPDIVLLDKQSKVMYVIEFSAPAEINIENKEREKRTKYLDLLFQLRRLYPEYQVRLVVLIIGALGGMKDTILAELKKIPECQRSQEQLVRGMQKAVVLGSLRLLRQMNLADDH